MGTKKDKKMILTSVQMQQVIFGQEYFYTWITPILRFGKLRKNERSLSIYIPEKKRKKIHDLYSELNELVGCDISVLKSKATELHKKYNEK